MAKFLVILMICIAICFAQDNTTVEPNTTSSDETTELTTLTTEPSTTTASTESTTTQSTTSSSQTTQTTTESTTTQSDTTNSETTESTTLTTEPATTKLTTLVSTTEPYDPTKLNPLNFTVPPNEPNRTCLRMDFELLMKITYPAVNGAKVYNATLNVAVPAKVDRYDGVCAENYNSINIQFWNEWHLSFNYTLKDDKYELSEVTFVYNVNKAWFPFAETEGLETVQALNLHEFGTTKGSSYKCNAKSTLNVNSNVTFEFSNYHAEPFLKEYKGQFDTAVDCAADNEETSKLVPIIVGSALAFLIVLVLIAYLIGRRRHRSGYETV